ncbi:MAG: hypothetical protein IJE48_08775 [Clostridia bacterium]|nr:hypothetical protein [Clostridia bacterium]
MKKIISILLCAAIVVSLFGISSFAVEEKKTDCDGSCEFYPTIIIPGLGQSGVFVADENGEILVDDSGKRVSAFPAYIQLPKIIKRALVPALLSLITQRDAGLSDAFADVIKTCFEINASDLEAQNTGNVILERYYKPYSECTEEEQELINEHIPFELYHTDLPKDHLYYFTYNSFGNHIDVTKELYDYIHMVMEQTGHNKINLVPISQGGTFANAIFEYYPEIMDVLHKVIYIVPALDGSTIIGDVFNGRVNFLNPDYLYHGFLENSGLMDKGTSRMIEVIARILPDEVLMSALNKGVKYLVEDIMTRSTSMWALCPSGDYPSAAQLYLSKPEMASIKEQTYKYYQAQLNSDANIKKLLEKGVQIFNVAEYDVNMINVGENWNTQNADYIIQLDSTSMGAYAAKVGETLPEDYVQANTYCSNPEHNHISPDRVVDASTGLLPDTTFYFDGQKHERTRNNDVILKLAFHLIAHDDITDVYSSPAFPQFNIGRDVWDLHEMFEIVDGIDKASLSAEDKAELDAAVLQAKTLLDTTVCEPGDFEKAENRLNAILVKIGAVEAEEVKDYTFFENLSEWLYENYGTNGYSEMPRISLNIIFGAITEFFNTVFA